MPQGRRKVPFSGKAKKEQLKLKKQRQGQPDGFSLPPKKIDHRFNERTRASRYALMFHRETDEEVKERKELALQELRPVSEKECEVIAEDYYVTDLDFPKRPKWSYDLSKEALEARETKYFNEYVKNIEGKFSRKELSYFELNLETWRQLWRVLEMSDIVLYIVDIRFSALMFPPLLYDYVVKNMKKSFILVLNKIDLAPAPLVVAWKEYFQERYPELHIVMFTSLPGYNLMGNQTNTAGLQVRRRRGKIRMAAEGTQVLLDACKKIVGNEVDLTSWEEKVKEEMNVEYDDDDDKVEVGETIEEKSDTTFYQHERFKHGLLTIGCIGQPNVGKSSLMNAIKGKKVVSVSKTPGHTKHFQTIFLTRNVRLCDCPGLVFPSKLPKTLQILMGSFPIAQLREPYTTIRFLAERLNLPKLLKIEHPENDDAWSAMDICDGWAKKRGYLTARAARLDSYRAANSLLRMALDGKICLCLRPPGYAETKEMWASHPEVEKVLWIQAKSKTEGNADDDLDLDLSDYEEKPVEKEIDGCELDEEKDSEDENDNEDDDDSDDAGPAQLVNPFAVLQEN